MNTQHEVLRALLAEEVRRAPLATDISATVMRAAKRSQHRRATLAAAGLISAAATVVTAVAASGLVAGTTDADDTRVAAVPTTQSTGGPSPTGSIVSDDQWNTAVAETFTTLLPERFGPVSVIDNASEDGWTFEVGGSQPFNFNIGLQGRLRGDDTVWACGLWSNNGPCAEKVTEGWTISAGHEAIPAPGDEDDGIRGATLYASKDNLIARVNLFTQDPAQLVPITDDELVLIAESAEFLNLLRLGVDYEASRPDENRVLNIKNPNDPGDDVTKTIPDPVWPGN